MEKVGRNDPCPCGSGKKYKSCCLKIEQEAARPLSGTRKFKAKVISAGGEFKKEANVTNEAQESVSYTSLLERSFGEAIKEKKDETFSADSTPNFEVSEEKK